MDLRTWNLQEIMDNKTLQLRNHKLEPLRNKILKLNKHKTKQPPLITKKG